MKKTDETDSVKVALNRAMALCAGREYCREDIHVKLISWGLDESKAARILDILVKENFINEARYASAFARDKFRYFKWGKLKIAAHLGSKKINQESINSALKLLDEDEYRKEVRNILIARRRTIRAKSKFDLKGKLMRFGLSRGYESNLLYDIINDLE